MEQASEQALVVGAAGGLGMAMAERWAGDARFKRVCCVARAAPRDAGRHASKKLVLATDHGAESIDALVEQVLDDEVRLSKVLITLGTLHGDDYQPEKTIQALDAEAMQRVHYVSCILPMLWLAALLPGLRRNPDCRIAVISARVGSIGDNQLGGWYSYRSAKAALNMALRCAAIEMARRAPGVKLLAYHPGTVATALSEPFQRNVPEGRLFTPEFAMQCLDDVLESLPLDGDLSYLDWAGKPIPW